MNNITKKKLAIFIFCFSFFFLCFLFYLWREIYFPREPLKTEAEVFVISRGEGTKEISNNLAKQGLIRSAASFKIYTTVKGVAGSLQAGEYSISPSMTIPEIVEKFVSGETLKIKLTFPEGLTLTQINKILNNSNLTRSGPLLLNLATFKVGNFKGGLGFLSDAPDETSLEGFLFPDTYFFETDIEEEIVKVFLKNFDRKLTPDLREEIKKQNKTIFQIVTMASLIEKEVRTLEDKKMVSGILWKRLQNNIPLQVDATITYITGKKSSRVSIEETKIDSPYNTYKYVGLPQGPICNPGIDSILAAVYPEESQFWYYLSTPEGETIFRKTLQEHNKAKAEYLK